MCSFLCHFSFGAQGPLHETKQVCVCVCVCVCVGGVITLCDRPLVLFLSPPFPIHTHTHTYTISRPAEKDKF